MVTHKSRCLRWIRPGLAVLVFAILPVLTTSSSAAARGMKPLVMKQRYVRVLGTLATGDLDAAVEELMEFEQAATGDEQAWRYVDNLWRAKLQVIRDLLSSQSPDLLMPIILMHHDAYFLYSELERNHLAQHSRTMSAELAKIFADRSQSAEANVFSGWVLTSFGAYLWSPSNIGMSADLFYRAHLVDPQNAMALRGLATAWERNGDYEKAIEYAIKALRLEKGDPELSLRLALCLLRYKDSGPNRAMQALEELTGPDNPRWVRSVAYQEIARAYLAEEESSQAESVLREGLQANPGDQQLSLQLASILDSQRKRTEANGILDNIEIYGWERDSSRQTYDFWVPADLDPIRAELHEEMKSGLTALKAALAASSAGGAGP